MKTMFVTQESVDWITFAKQGSLGMTSLVGMVHSAHQEYALAQRQTQALGKSAVQAANKTTSTIASATYARKEKQEQHAVARTRSVRQESVEWTMFA
mmetsp:Transcript_5912/g.12955  ORF Transcript_5912/g.12955 Transcript_5912/m.12955 type:complete len:97 (+) Transcript_5912:780-1070(+)